MMLYSEKGTRYLSDYVTMHLVAGFGRLCATSPWKRFPVLNN